MPPLPPPSERTLQAAGARRPAPGSPTTGELVKLLRTVSQETPSLAAVFDARSIAGERHLLSAWAHLGRSRGRGEPRLRDRGAEYALYVAGDDQLPRALAKVGVSDSTTEMVVVTERPLEPAQLIERLRLEPSPASYPRPADEETLERLGVAALERASVPRAAWEGLVLERVALVDLTAPAGHGTTAKH
ncbi:MAG TPA: KEOPS complex subunit Cgi121 [Thermoplasmata archaeon]|nr:KEOPS complex subunit Cgi121 [Thermoplasmata archaeon]